MAPLMIIGMLLFGGLMAYAGAIGAGSVTEVADHLFAHFWQFQLGMLGLITIAFIIHLATSSLGGKEE